MNSRTSTHQRLPELESELNFFSELLTPLELQVLPQEPRDPPPTIFIMGCARSGSTLLYQYLAASGVFTYPTNFVSRFYYAPYIGARLQRMLFSLDNRHEITPPSLGQEQFASKLGKTLGAMAPHEFWYFWRRFFHFTDEQCIPENKLSEVDGSTFRRELSAFQSVTNLPLVLKGMILNWHIPFLAELIPNSFFIHIYRDQLANAQSLFKARIDFFGTANEWYSFRPPGYATTQAFTPELQTLWQVRQTKAAVDEGLRSIGTDRSLAVSYEGFCDNPKRVFSQIADMTGNELPTTSSLPTQFKHRACEQNARWADAIDQLKSFIQPQKPQHR